MHTMRQLRQRDLASRMDSIAPWINMGFEQSSYQNYIWDGNYWVYLVPKNQLPYGDLSGAIIILQYSHFDENDPGPRDTLQIIITDRGDALGASISRDWNRHTKKAKQIVEYGYTNFTIAHGS